MYVPPQRQESLLLLLVFSGLFGWSWQSLELQTLPVVPYGLGFLYIHGRGQGAERIAYTLAKYFLMRRDAMAATTQRGSASWATNKELKRAGLYDTSAFLGCDTSYALCFLMVKPIWLSHWHPQDQGRLSVSRYRHSAMYFFQ